MSISDVVRITDYSFNYKYLYTDFTTKKKWKWVRYTSRRVGDGRRKDQTNNEIIHAQKTDNLFNLI